MKVFSWFGLASYGLAFIAVRTIQIFAVPIAWCLDTVLKIVRVDPARLQLGDANGRSVPAHDLGARLVAYDLRRAERRPARRRSWSGDDVRLLAA